MKHIIVHHEAELELWQAVDYYESKCAGLGLDLEQEVRRAFINIQKTPNRWTVKCYGTRWYLLQRFPYAIYYLDSSHSTHKP